MLMVVAVLVVGSGGVGSFSLFVVALRGGGDLRSSRRWIEVDELGSEECRIVVVRNLDEFES